MTTWIGPLGSLIPFYAPSSEESSSTDSHVFYTPLGGDVGVTVIGDQVRPRVWEVGISAAYPQEVATIQGLSYGEWGIGPFVWIPSAAETKNLLGKRDSLALKVPGGRYVKEAPGVPILTSEGPAGSGYIITGTDMPPHMNMGTAPVIPGKPVTARAWVQALEGYGANIRMRFFTATNAYISASPMAATNSTEGTFLYVTTTPPEGAAYAVLDGAGAVLTRPQVTWTEEARSWAPSAASSNVVISSLSDAVRFATGKAGEESITDHKFTVTELRA